MPLRDRLPIRALLLLALFVALGVGVAGCEKKPLTVSRLGERAAYLTDPREIELVEALVEARPPVMGWYDEANHTPENWRRIRELIWAENSPYLWRINWETEERPGRQSVFVAHLSDGRHDPTFGKIGYPWSSRYYWSSTPKLNIHDPSRGGFTYQRSNMSEHGFLRPIVDDDRYLPRMLPLDAWLEEADE